MSYFPSFSAFHAFVNAGKFGSLGSRQHATRRRLKLPVIVLSSLIALSTVCVQPAQAIDFFGAFTVKGSGNMVKESRATEGIKFIKLKTGARVEIIQGTKESVDTEIDDNLVPYVQINIRDGLLTVDDEKTLRSNRFKIMIYTKNVESISTGGSTALHADSLAVGKLQISTGGSSAINIGQLKAEKLSVDLGGSSAIKLRGEVAVFSAALGGSSVLGADSLLAQSANVQSAGSANASVWVASGLTAQSSGSSVLRYRGSPKVTKAMAGSSSIEATE